MLAELLITGIFICTGERKELIVAGLKSILSLMGEKSFYGQLRPKCIMTDDCDAEDAAICDLWLETKRLLCTFHLGQAMWRWL